MQPCNIAEVSVKKQISQSQSKFVGIGLANLQIFPATLGCKLLVKSIRSVASVLLSAR